MVKKTKLRKKALLQLNSISLEAKHLQTENALATNSSHEFLTGIKQIITSWALNEVIVPKSSMLSRLLKDLHTIHNELPKTFKKTLLPSPQLTLKSMLAGKHAYFPN